MSVVSRIFSRLPLWVRRVLIAATERDGRTAVWIKARAARSVVVPAPAIAETTAPRRMLIAPFNYSGQAWEWARTARDFETEVVNLAVEAPGDHGFSRDFSVPATVFLGSVEWKNRQAVALESFTHLLIESFTSPLGNGRGNVFRGELTEWSTAGTRIAFLCHGSDIRSPQAHLERNPFSPFRFRESDPKRLQRRTDEAQALIKEMAVPVFVSTPDLLHDVPEATWLPLVVESDRWALAAANREFLSEIKPLVVHAPTSPTLKGSAYVEQATKALQAELQYERLSGVPADQMPAAIAAADIVIDQLLIGSYGVAACEALAAGRVVIGNVDEAIRAQVLQLSGIELPIIQADPSNIEEVLNEIVRDAERLREYAKAGPLFIASVHSGTRTSEALAEFLAS